MVYHALAEALAPPALGIEDLLLDAVTTGARDLGSVACQRAALALAQLPRPSLQALRDRYARLTAGPDHRPVVLYESLYRYGRLAGPATWEVEEYYQALGLAPIEGELPDHASVELAFLGYLAAAEAEARAAGDGRLVARLRAEQRTFLRAHAGTWLPQVGAALADAGDSLYAVVGRLLSDFLAEERGGRKRARRAGTWLPTLHDPAACTLCGLCVGSCPLGALGVVESATETALTLDPQRCIGCDRCVRICPEEVLTLAPDTQARSANENGHQVMRQSPRAICPNCGRPTVSQAELDAVVTRLQPDPVTQQRLSLCVECKSWNV
jgi:TorA maturation chaperone TorD/NAD-dependent dihydropyrimidine dehydrogenase PreA subunit